MHENNKVTILNLGRNKIGNDGAQYLSLALMNENNKVIRLNLNSNKIGTPGLVALLKAWRFSLMNDLGISAQHEIHDDLRKVLQTFNRVLNRHTPRLICLASVRIISRIGNQSPHFRMLSSDSLIRIMQRLGWYIEYQETLRVLEKYDDTSV